MTEVRAMLAAKNLTDENFTDFMAEYGISGGGLALVTYNATGTLLELCASAV